MIDHRARLGEAVDADVDRVAEASSWLRKEREFAFYGDIDLIPTDHYLEADAARARDEAVFVVGAAAKVIEARPDPAA